MSCILTPAQRPILLIGFMAIFEMTFFSISVPLDKTQKQVQTLNWMNVKRLLNVQYIKQSTVLIQSLFLMVMKKSVWTVLSWGLQIPNKTYFINCIYLLNIQHCKRVLFFNTLARCWEHRLLLIFHFTIHHYSGNPGMQCQNVMTHFRVKIVLVAFYICKCTKKGEMKEILR